MQPLLFVILLASLPLAALASCEAELEEAARVAAVGNVDLPIVFASCEELAGNPSVVAALVAVEHQDVAEQTTYDLHLMVLNQSSRKVVAHLYRPEIWASNAFKIDSAAVNAGSFAVALGAATFGIIERWSSSSRIAPYAIEVLSIYKQQGEQIVPVVSDLVTSIYQNVGCDVQTTRELTFGPEPNSNILPVITLTERADSVARENEPCDPIEYEVVTYRLEPTKGAYRVPEELRLNREP